VAVAALGAVLNAHLAAEVGAGTDPNVVLQGSLRAGLAPETLARLVGALDGGLHAVYLAMAGMAAMGLLVALGFPRGSALAHAHEEARAQ